MKIEQAEVAFGVCHSFSSECSVRIESDYNFRSTFADVASRLPEAGNETSLAVNAAAARVDSTADSLRLLEALIARMLEFLIGHLGLEGEASELSDLREVVAASSAGDGSGKPLREATMSWNTTTTERIREQESSDFCSRGKLCTADGRTLDFQLDLSLKREYAADRVSTRQEKTVLRDPLVINFDGKAAQFSGKRFAFDLNADGLDESLRVLGGGSGFLAIDRNGDGRVSDGSELFGAGSGDGFADLAALDEDGNHWLDEGDSAFDRLRIWQFDDDGQSQLTTLREQGVGALYLGSIETPFSLTDEENSLLAQIRASGVYLREDGRAGALQQIDLAV